MEYFESAMALSLNLISYIIDFIISAYSTTKTKMPLTYVNRFFHQKKSR